MKKINSFRGKFAFLGNYFPCPVMLDGLEFPSVEHAFVAAKTTDIGQRRAIQILQTPGKARRYGGRLETRENWEGMKLQVMERLLRQKFAGSELAAKLVQTGQVELLEGNSGGDTFWGVRPGCGMGHNHLGKLLMQIRSELVTDRD